MKRLLPVPVMLWTLLAIAVAVLVANRYLLNPVGRYVPHYAGPDQILMRMDTVTGRVEWWRGKSGWMELGKFPPPETGK